MSPYYWAASKATATCIHLHISRARVANSRHQVVPKSAAKAAVVQHRYGLRTACISLTRRKLSLTTVTASGFLRLLFVAASGTPPARHQCLQHASPPPWWTGHRHLAEENEFKWPTQIHIRAHPMQGQLASRSISSMAASPNSFSMTAYLSQASIDTFRELDTPSSQTRTSSRALHAGCSLAAWSSQRPGSQ